MAVSGLNQVAARPERVAELRRVRRSIARQPAAQLPGYSFAHGSNIQGVPVLVDLGEVRQEHAADE